MKIASQQWLDRWVSPLAPAEGSNRTLFKRAKIRRRSRKTRPQARLFQPHINVVLQGTIKAFTGEESHYYPALTYAVMTAPVPFEREYIDVSQENPLLCVELQIDLSIVSELLLKMELEEDLMPTNEKQLIAKPKPLTDDMQHAIGRLLQTLHDASDAQVLAPLYYREVLYHVLRSEECASLQMLIGAEKRNHGIAKVLEILEKDYAANYSVEELAKMACMSTSSFHAGFKAATSQSPLQYVKSIRLHKARALMLSKGMSASQAAYQVGYASPSQFSREFKRYFGNSPIQEAARYRAA